MLSQAQGEVCALLPFIFFLFFLFFLVRAMGAGDVKLMAAVGCLAPSGVSSMGDALKQAVMIVLYSAMAGGILALGYTIIALIAHRTTRADRESAIRAASAATRRASSGDAGSNV